MNKSRYSHNMRIRMVKVNHTTLDGIFLITCTCGSLTSKLKANFLSSTSVKLPLNCVTPLTRRGSERKMFHFVKRAFTQCVTTGT